MSIHFVDWPGAALQNSLDRTAFRVAAPTSQAQRRGFHFRILAEEHTCAANWQHYYNNN